MSNFGPLRTQFDDVLLAHSQSGECIAANHGRQIVVRPDGTTLTALAWGGESPRLALWRNRELVAEQALAGQPSPPCLLLEPEGEASLWLTIDNALHFCSRWDRPLEPVAAPAGCLEDAILLPNGDTLLALRGENLHLAAVSAGRVNQHFSAKDAGHAVLATSPNGEIHLVFEYRQGLEYRHFDGDFHLLREERVCEAFCSDPALLMNEGRLYLAFLSETGRLPSYKRWSDAWERLGRGNAVAVAVLEDGIWRRSILADATQFVKPLYPTDTAYGGGAEAEIRVRLDEFGPPSLTAGADGVVRALWANIERRHVYATRFSGSDFSPPEAVRGPLEQLSGPVLTTARSSGALPIGLLTKSRVHLDALASPPGSVDGERQIDFLDFEDLARWSGVEIRVNRMDRHPLNPIIPIGGPGELGEGGLLADIFREDTGWRAQFWARGREKSQGWQCDGLATSRDGIVWAILPSQPLSSRYQVDGDSEHMYTLRFLRDEDEPNPAWRYKGFWRAKDAGPWGWVPVVSPDAKNWTKSAGEGTVLNADDDLRICEDPYDIPARRFKAHAIARSFCGRVACQWSSPDGVHWNDERETLDFQNPFGAKPDRGTTGRILLDSWSGPDDEDELHGGYVFRDGDRWLLHYMKWTADGHVYTGLATSRDGLNFSRVAGGASPLPLGDPGTWEAGRIAIREAPFLVDGVWRQYYTGCGWKHGMGGVGAATSQFGVNAPNQVGIAQMRAGRWAYLQLQREADEAEILTIPLDLAGPHNLRIDLEGLERRGSELQIAVIDPGTQAEKPGFGFESCDPFSPAGVTWNGRGLEHLGAARIQIAVRLRGEHLKLFNLKLEAAA